MHRIVFLDRATLDAHLSTPGIEHEWTDHETTTPDQVVDRLAGATIAVVNKVPMRAETIRALPELRLIAVAATGVDNVDLEAAREAGVAVCNVTGYAAESVAEHVMAGLLALRRNLFAYRRAVARGAWAQSHTFAAHLFSIEDLHDSTLAIYGHGAIGRATAARARAFGMQVMLSERRGADTVREGYTPFEEALERCDVLSLHCPLDRDNAGLIDEAAIQRMKSTALLVNTARGRLVDLTALHRALLDNRLGGAMLDVMPQEPPVDGHVLLSADLPNLLVTPHVAWASHQAQHTLATRLVANIEAFAAGAPHHDLAAAAD